MKALLRFNRLIYLTGYRFVLPLTVIVTYDIVAYFIYPFKLTAYLCVSMIGLFVLSLLDGFLSYEIPSEGMGQILTVKAGGARQYYMSRELFVVQLAGGYTVLFLVFPYACSLFGAGLFDRTLLPSEYWSVFLLHFLMSLCGYELGSLFEPRLSSFHWLSAVLMPVTVAGTVFQYISMKAAPFAKWFVWIFPPTADILRISHEHDFFCGVKIFYIAFRLVLYTTLVISAKEYLLYRKKR